MHPRRPIALVLFVLLSLVAGTSPSPVHADPPRKKEPPHPADEPVQPHLLRPSATDENGNPVLSYPGRAPHSLAVDPGNHPLSHLTIVTVTAASGYVFYVAASGIGALGFCDSWSQWSKEVFTRSKCGVAPLLVGGLGLWAGVTVASAYVHGYYYNGNRLEAVGLTGLGTLAGGGVTAGIWALTDNRIVTAFASMILPMVGAIIGAELAAHDGTTEAFDPTWSRANIDVLMTDSMIGAGIHGSF